MAPSVRAYAPTRSSKPHPRVPPPVPRFKPGPMLVASGGVMTAASKGVKQTTKFQYVPRDLSDRAMDRIANLLVGATLDSRRHDPNTHMQPGGSVHPPSGEQVWRRSQWPTSLTPSPQEDSAQHSQLVSDVLRDLNTPPRAANVWRYSSAESTWVLCQLSPKSRSSPITLSTVLEVSALQLYVQTRTLPTTVLTDSGLSVEGHQQFSGQFPKKSTEIV